MNISQPFHDGLSTLLIKAKTNYTNSCQGWILLLFTKAASAHPSMKYYQIIWSHLKEEAHSSIHRYDNFLLNH